jgi:hypothetical protein
MVGRCPCCILNFGHTYLLLCTSPDKGSWQCKYNFVYVLLGPAPAPGLSAQLCRHGQRVAGGGGIYLHDTVIVTGCFIEKKTDFNGQIQSG